MPSEPVCNKLYEEQGMLDICGSNIFFNSTKFMISFIFKYSDNQIILNS